MRAAASAPVAVVALCLCLGSLALAAQGDSPFILVRTLHVGEGVTDLCFSPIGDCLVIAAQATEIFDTANWNLTKSFPSASSDLVFSPDGSLLAERDSVIEVASGGTVWSGDAGLPLFSADGSLLFVGSDNTAVWNVGTWNQADKLHSPAPLRPVAMALNPEGTALYVVELGEERVVVDKWDIHTGSFLSSSAYSIWDWAALSSGELFVSGHGLAVSAWNVDSAVLVSSFATLVGPLSQSVAGLTDIQLVASGRFAAAAVGSVIYLVSVPNGAIVTTLPGDPAGVTALAASIDGTRLAAGGRSGRVDIWDISPLLPYSCSGFTISKVDWQRGCATIKNTTATTLDLLGWTISDGAGSFTFAASVPVSAGESYVLCKRVYNPTNSSQGLTIDETGGAISLFCPELCGATKVSTQVSATRP